MRVIPLTGTDEDRILTQELGLIRPYELHSTDQVRLFLGGVPIGPAFYNTVNTNSLVLLNEDEARGVFPGDFAYNEETNSVWLCRANRGEDAGTNDDDWINLNSAVGDISGTELTTADFTLLGRSTESSTGEGAIEQIKIAGGLVLEDGFLSTSGPLINTTYTAKEGTLIGRWEDSSDSTEGGLQEISLGKYLSFADAVLEVTGLVELEGYDEGDILVADDYGNLAPLTIGKEGQVLTVTGGVPTWEDATGGGDITTDKAWAAKGDLIVATGNDAAAIVSIGSSNQVLTVVGGTAAWANLPTVTTIANDAIWAAKGDIVYATGNDAAAVLSIGSTNQVLTVVSGQPAWANAPTGDVSKDTIWDAAGDLAVGTGSDAAARLARGSNGQVLTSGASTISWVTPKTVATDVIFDAKGDLAVGTGADTASRLAVGTNGQILSANSAQATGLQWIANNAWANPMTTKGDMVIRDASNANARLAIGKTGQLLNVAGTGVPAWTDRPTQKGSWVEGNVDSPDVPLNWVSNGDSNGVFYYIGTDFGINSWSNPQATGQILAAAYPNTTSGTVSKWTNRNPEYEYVGGGGGTNWIAFDLGNDNRQLLLKEYTFQNYSSADRYARNWKIQGTNSVASWNSAGIIGASWTDLDTRVNDTTMGGGAYAWAHYTIASPGSNRYRFFRILQTGGDSLGGNYICTNEIELYGDFQHELGTPDYLLNLLPQLATPDPPAEGFLLFVESGNLKCIDDLGNVTTLA